MKGWRAGAVGLAACTLGPLTFVRGAPQDLRAPADFDPIVDAHSEMQRFFRRLIQRNEAIGYEWLVNCGRRDSTARVAHLLCETAVRMHVQDAHMFNPFTQQQIADITGQTSVNVNRVLADMERQGLIKRKGRDIEFTDWTEMRRVASFQPEYLAI